MDIFARLVADTAPKYIGQPFVVINKPGAGGAIAAADVANSKPDGYKLLTIATSNFVSSFKTQKMVFNPADLIPLWSFMQFRTGLFVKADSPHKTLNDLLEDAKKKPDKITWGHPGRGLSVQIATSLLFRKADVKMIEVPHKGSSELVAALLGGHTDVITTSFGSVSSHIAGGKMRSLVVYTNRRFSNFPEIPTAKELGFEDVDKVSAIVSLYVHKNTPDKIKSILKDGLKKTCHDPALKAGIERIGEEYLCDEPDTAIELIEKGEEVVTPILKELGIYVQQN
jgi:tripartite-type tricarboxylate transporter receptor subunit TctC